MTFATLPHSLQGMGGTPTADKLQSQPVTDWAARIAWVVGLILFVALVYWLMREGWKWRGQLQSGIPDLPPIPEETGPARLALTGRYHGTTTAGQWLDRIVAHGLGVRSRVELTLTAEGLAVVRPGAGDFFVPAARLRGARLDKAIAGKVLTEGGLLVVTWEHGGAEYDSGFRSDHAAEHAAWVAALGGPPAVEAGQTAETAPADAAASSADSTTTEGP